PLALCHEKTPRLLGGAFLAWQGLRSAAGQYVGVDTGSRIDRLGDRMIVVARDDDRIAVRVDPADHADMASATAAHDGDGADLRPRDAGPVARVSAGEIAAARVTGVLEHHVHERAAPQAAAPGGVGADVFARLDDQRIARASAVGRVRMRLR